MAHPDDASDGFSAIAVAQWCSAGRREPFFAARQRARSRTFWRRDRFSLFAWNKREAYPEKKRIFRQFSRAKRRFFQANEPAKKQQVYTVYSE